MARKIEKVNLGHVEKCDPYEYRIAKITVNIFAIKYWII